MSSFINAELDFAYEFDSVELEMGQDSHSWQVLGR